jgi:hypothetical protein
LILYSKKEGIGYLSPLGNADEGSDVLLSTIGCLAIEGIDGLAVLITFGTAAVVVEKFTFCIGSILKRLRNLSARAYDVLCFYSKKIVPDFSAFALQ